jgi:hypothetical protein
MSIFDIFRREQGALDENGHFSPEAVEARNQQYINTMPAPLRPTNPVEQRLAERTMRLIPDSQIDPQAGQLPADQQGPPAPLYGQYESGRRVLRDQKQEAYSNRMQYAQQELNKKLSNPFFKVTDLISDVARETIGLPFNILTGGNAFDYDPDNDARTSTRKRLESLEALQSENNELYQNSLEARGVAMEAATNQRMNAETNARNSRIAANPFNQHNTADSTYESQQAFLDHHSRTGEYRPDLLVPKRKLKYMRNPETNMVEVFQVNPDGSEYRLGNANELGLSIDAGSRVAASKSWNEAADNWANQSEKYRQVTATRETRTRTMANQIAIIRDLAEEAAGYGGLLKGLPDSKYKTFSTALGVLKGIIGFNELRALKESGATLGPIAVMEMQALQAVQGNLDETLSAEVILDTINEIEGRSQVMEQAMVDYQAQQIAQYGTRENRAANPYGAAYDQRTQTDESEPTFDPNMTIMDD